MKRHIYYLLFLSILIQACGGVKISPIANSNRFIKSMRIHIINDSLKLKLSTPADISYLLSTKAIKADLKKYRIRVTNPLLFYGQTDDPSYRVYASIGDLKERVSPKKIIIDTLIDGKLIHLTAVETGTGARANMESDLRQIKASIKTGDAYVSDTGDVMSVLNRSMGNNTYLRTLREMQNFPIPKNQGNSMEIQMQLTMASFLGDNDEYKSLIDRIENGFKVKEVISADIKKAELTKTAFADSLVKAVTTSRILMINENHFYPSHRRFIISLLPLLKEQGYTHLALEALSPSADSLLNLSNGFPQLETGFYTREQNYGNLLREAKSLGFTFVAYENTDPKKDRELGQAENLYRKTLGVNAKAKVLVIAGIDHILEEPNARGKKWMARVFKDLYGIDPITISQTHLNGYRKLTNQTTQLMSRAIFTDPNSLPPVDYFVLNNDDSLPPLWDKRMSYTNKTEQLLQINLFYKDELKREADFHKNVAYYTSLVKVGEKVELPLKTNRQALLIAYDQLGQVVERKTVN